MKKAWQFYYEEYLAKTTNSTDKELDAKLEKVNRLIAEIESDIEEIADSEASVSEEAFEAGFICGSASN